jgi:hypothetical protein
MNAFSLHHILNLIPFFLYAETHYRIPGLFNRLFKREPEIIVDVPHRLQKSQALPVLLIIKDSHRFPMKLEKLDVQIHDCIYSFIENQYINSSFWYKIFYINLPEQMSGQLIVDTRVVLQINGRRLTVHNDNYRTASHRPFLTELDEQPLPGTKNCIWADLHCHSIFTDDQVEFGPPLPALQAMAKAIGINVVAVTDHSYDLDDQKDNYLANDPELVKWKELQKSINELNTKNDVLLIPGEEISIGNSQNKNIHLLILNDPVFYPGYGDSGEKWLQTKPHLQANALLAELSPGVAAFAAHPEARPPFLQRLLLGREKWHDKDYAHPGLHGMQIWNGEGASGFHPGIKAWVRQLLNGRRLTIIGGNDSHGDFNRVRHIKIPFWSILESTHHVFGRVRTGILSQKPMSPVQIIDALKQGRCIISNGPVALIYINNMGIGETVTETSYTINMSISSTPAFGYITGIDVFIGDLEKKQEAKWSLSVPPACSHFDHTIRDVSLPGQGYVRLEAASEKNGHRYGCLTNPVYLAIKII